MAWPPTYRGARQRRGYGRPLTRPPVAVGGQPQFQPFRPYKPPPPPSGSYDPALDAQLGSAQRGYGDLQQDIGTAGLRAGVDYGLTQEEIQRNRSLADTDLQRSLNRGGEDYRTQVAGLQRSYQQLQRRQSEGARAAGVLSGGLALRAAAIRAQNQAIDRAPIDTGFERLREDIGTRRERVGEEADTALGRLALDFQRGGIDRGTTLERAGRENTAFGLDVASEKAFQAAQSGYVPPGAPKGQGVTGGGVPYREKRVGGFIYRYDKTGKVLSRRKARR